MGPGADARNRKPPRAVLIWHHSGGVKNSRTVVRWSCLFSDAQQNILLANLSWPINYLTCRSNGSCSLMWLLRNPFCEACRIHGWQLNLLCGAWDFGLKQGGGYCSLKQSEEWRQEVNILGTNIFTVCCAIHTLRAPQLSCLQYRG